MNQNHTFTYVIGYRHQLDRLNNLRRVLDWINGFMGVEVLLIEQDTHSKISHMGLRCKHVFLKSDKPYNKSWAFNYATKIAKSNIIIFADSDLIMDPNQFIEGLKHLELFEMVNPYNSVIDLEPHETAMQLEEVIRINRPGRGENDHQKVPICGGICMFRKDAINKIGGWNENFIGWGGEDDFVSIKVQHFLNWKQMEAKCYHLFHSRPQPDMNLYQKNLQLHNTYLNMTKEELSKQLYKDVARNGLKNKYDTF